MPRFYTGPLSVSQILAPSAVPFPSLSGLVGRYMANTGVTLSGPNIVAVADQSGAGNNLVNSGTVPFNVASAYNGKPAFDFGGAGALVNASFPMGTGTAISVWAVGRLASGATANAGLCGYAGGSNANDWDNQHSAGFIRDGTNAAVEWVFFSATAASGALSTDTNARFGGVITAPTTSTLTTYVDGSSAATGSNGNGLALQTNGNFGIGGRWVSSAWGTFWSGPILEFVVSNAPFSPTDFANLEVYATGNYGS